jgi:hypothetical protein
MNLKKCLWNKAGTVPAYAAFPIVDVIFTVNRIASCDCSIWASDIPITMIAATAIALAIIFARVDSGPFRGVCNGRECADVQMVRRNRALWPTILADIRQRCSLNVQAKYETLGSADGICCLQLS